MKNNGKAQIQRGAKPVPRNQVAALVWRVRRGRREFLLVTSRERRRWILPKGWAEPGQPDEFVACQEAWEEAGVVAETSRPVDLCTLRHRKLLANGVILSCQLRVYALRAIRIEGRYPEVGQRRRLWVTRERAERQLDVPGLRDWLPRL